MAERHTQPMRRDVPGRDPVLDLGGVPECPQGRRAFEALREVTRRYSALLEGLDAIVWQTDLPEASSRRTHARPLPFSFVSPQAEALLGYPVGQWLSEPDFWINHIHPDPDDRERMLAHCPDAAREHREHDVEYRMIAADGRAVCVCACWPSADGSRRSLRKYV